MHLEHGALHFTLETNNIAKTFQVHSNKMVRIQTNRQGQSENACKLDSQTGESDRAYKMGSQTGNSHQGHPAQAVGFQTPSQPYTFQASLLTATQANCQRPQVTASAPQPEPFRFEGSPQATPFAPPSQTFTFEADPIYPTHLLSSGFTPITKLTRSTSLDNVSNLVHDFERLGHQDAPDRVRTPPPTPPSPPATDARAELLCRRREPEYKEAATTKARKDGERTAKEVKRQAIRNDNEAKGQAQARSQSQEQGDRQVQPAQPFPPISPATAAGPQTSFAETLAFRPASGVSQSPWRVVNAPIPPPHSEAPVSLQFPDCDAMQKPPHLRPSGVKPTLQKGVLQKATDGTTFVLPKQPRSVRFKEVIDSKEDSGGEEQARNSAERRHSSLENEEANEQHCATSWYVQ